jgi:hypothetical protein
MLVDGVAPVRPEPALFEAGVASSAAVGCAGRWSRAGSGWSAGFQAFTTAWPWAWTPEQVEIWSGSGGWAHSTIRSYQGALAVFLDFTDQPLGRSVRPASLRLAA